MKNAAALAAVTPVTRDRYVDLLRVLSLGVVVFGHWLMAVVVTGADGSVRTTNLLAVEPALQPVTWLLQVMPVFFLVGGFSHATAWVSIERRGGGYADFARSRAGRLLRPTAVFAGVWLVLALCVELLGADHGILKLATRVVAQPLWFVGVYLGIVALAPAMLRLHRWTGRWAPLVPVAFGLAALVVDVARFAYGVPYIAFLNLAFVWLGVHQVGFLYADGHFRGPRVPAALLAAGLAGTVLCTTVGPYPTSMVGMPGEKVSNMSPPTFALVMCAVSLIGLTMLVRGPVTRWLARPAVWRGVVAANGLAMTAFLWHLTAMFLATAATMALGFTGPAVGSATWWVLRPGVARRPGAADRRAGGRVPRRRPAACHHRRLPARRVRGGGDGAVHGGRARVLGGRLRWAAGRPHRDADHVAGDAPDLGTPGGRRRGAAAGGAAVPQDSVTL